MRLRDGIAYMRTNESVIVTDNDESVITTDTDHLVVASPTEWFVDRTYRRDVRACQFTEADHEIRPAAGLTRQT